MKDSKKREYLLKILENYLQTCKSLMEYFKAVASTKEAKNICSKSIRDLNKSLKVITLINHIEILEYLYATFIGNNAIAYSVSGKVVLSKKLSYYDTNKGFKEFQEMLEEQKKENEEREKKRKESVEALKRAKEMGKKVEMVYDKDTKTTKPMIIEEKANA